MEPVQAPTPILGSWFKRAATKFVERIPKFCLNGPRLVLFRERGIRGPVGQLSKTTGGSKHNVQV